MTRQTFALGQTVMVREWRQQWREAVVVAPEIVDHAQYNYRRSIYYVEVEQKCRYKDGTRRFQVLNSRSHVLSMEEYAPVEARLVAHARSGASALPVRVMTYWQAWRSPCGMSALPPT